MIHWLASAYAKKGITVNGVAPALIANTNMVPGPNGELEKSEPSSAAYLPVLPTSLLSLSLEP